MIIDKAICHFLREASKVHTAQVVVTQNVNGISVFILIKARPARLVPKLFANGGSHLVGSATPFLLISVAADPADLAKSIACGVGLGHQIH